MNKLVISSVVVLEDRPWPRGSSRTKIHVLGLMSADLGLGGHDLGLGLEGSGLGLGLEGFGLDNNARKFFWGMFRVDA